MFTIIPHQQKMGFGQENLPHLPFLLAKNSSVLHCCAAGGVDGKTNESFW